jgi:hypothetical protein
MFGYGGLFIRFMDGSKFFKVCQSLVTMSPFCIFYLIPSESIVKHAQKNIHHVIKIIFMA